MIVLQGDSKWTLICLKYYNLIDYIQEYAIFKNVVFF